MLLHHLPHGGSPELPTDWLDSRGKAKEGGEETKISMIPWKLTGLCVGKMGKSITIHGSILNFVGFSSISIVKNFCNNSHPFWRTKSSLAIRNCPVNLQGDPCSSKSFVQHPVLGYCPTQPVQPPPPGHGSETSPTLLLLSAQPTPALGKHRSQISQLCSWKRSHSWSDTAALPCEAHHRRCSTPSR